MELDGPVETWELVARESIRDLIARYNANGDSGRFAQVAELFTEDARYDVEGVVHTGASGVLEVMTAAAAAMGSDGAPSMVRHLTSTTQIDVTSETDASARSYWVVLLPHGLDHWGRYLDTFSAVDGRWRFASRRVVEDGEVEGGWAHRRHQLP